MENVRTIDELMSRLNEMKEEFGSRKKTADDVAVKKTAEYKRAFWEHMNTGIPENVLREGSDGSGGYLVPDEYDNKLVEGLKEENILRDISTIIPTTYDLRIPTVVSGSTAQWVDETHTYIESDVTFGQIEIKAHKVGTRILVSDELLEDSGFDLEAHILREFAESIGNAEEEAFLTGNSSGRPTGLIYQAQVGHVTAEVGKVSLDDLIDLTYSLRKPYREKSVFIMSYGAYMELRKIKTANGRYPWNLDLVKDGYDTLFGYRVYVSKYLDNIAPGSKCILFGDFSYFWIGDRGKRIVKRLAERYADYGQVGFITSERVDAKLVLPEAVKVLHVRAA